MRETVFTIEGMHCSGCTRSVERVLRLLPGVDGARVEFAGHEARVRFDESRVTREQLIAAIERAGFHTRRVE